MNDMVRTDLDVAIGHDIDGASQHVVVGDSTLINIKDDDGNVIDFETVAERNVDNLIQDIQEVVMTKDFRERFKTTLITHLERYCDTHLPNTEPELEDVTE